MVWKLFYGSSSLNGGTLQQLRNLVNRRNVSSDPDSNFNAAEDFFHLVGIAHVVAASLKYFGMDDVNSIPDESMLPSDVLFLPKEERKVAVHTAVLGFVREFFSLDLHVLEQEDGHEEEEDEEDATNSDRTNGYAQGFLSFYWLYCEYEDAVKEGDGNRVLRCWKYFLQIFFVCGRTNYTLEAFRLLMQYYYLFSPRQAQQLLSSRFINTHGRPGKNIEADLHMEHLNRLCKSYIEALGPNSTDAAVLRAGRSIGTMSLISDNFDLTTGITIRSGAHSWRSIDKDLDKVINELHKMSNVFDYIPGRCHSAFKNYKSFQCDHTEIIAWMKNHLDRFT